MRRVARDRRGVAALEFCLVLPFLFLLLVGFLDIVYLARGHLRTQSTATQVAQIVSQCTSIASSDSEQVRLLALETLKPFSEKGRPWGVIVTAIGLNAANQPVVLWSFDHRPKNATGTPLYPTDGATLPPDFTMKASKVMFRTEVFAQLDATIFSRANSLLAPLMGSRDTVREAAGALLLVGRAPDATPLRTATSSRACLS